MKLYRSSMGLKRTMEGTALVLFALAAGGWGQGAGSIPLKLGLWETTVKSANVMSLPPEVEARIAAMPPAQQEMMRSRMGGTPVTSTTKSCVAKKQSVDDFLNRSQDRPGTKCTFSNRQESANGASFDTTCVTERGTMKGHSEFQMADDEHVSGTTHMEGEMTSPRGTMAIKIETTMTSKYLGADCGDVKPYTPPAQ